MSFTQCLTDHQHKVLYNVSFDNVNCNTINGQFAPPNSGLAEALQFAPPNSGLAEALQFAPSLKTPNYTLIEALHSPSINSGTETVYHIPSINIKGEPLSVATSSSSYLISSSVQNYMSSYGSWNGTDTFTTTVSGLYEINLSFNVDSTQVDPNNSITLELSSSPTWEVIFMNTTASINAGYGYSLSSIVNIGASETIKVLATNVNVGLAFNIFKWNMTIKRIGVFKDEAN